MIAFILLSYSEMVRRVAENSWAGCCPSGRSGLCTTAACWISCRRSFVSSLSVQVHQGPLVAPLSVQYNPKMIVQIERTEQKLKCTRRIFQSLNVFTPIDGEKKAKKRQYEEIQPDVEDFASQSSPAEPPQVLHGNFHFSAGDT